MSAACSSGEPNENELRYRKDMPRGTQRLGKTRRLTRKHFFQEAYAQRRKQVGKYMVLWLRTGDDANLRLGVVSSRKVGNAVRRNRARRRLREIFRRHRHRLRGPVDVVLVARYGVVDAPWQAITEELLRLTQRAGILKKNRNEWETNE